jgi:ABC-type glutathione transport system ATPase component
LPRTQPRIHILEAARISRLVGLVSVNSHGHRAHVRFIKSEYTANGEAAWREAKHYFDLAGRLNTLKLPLLVAIGGLSGTGKSVLPRSLASMIEPPPGAIIVCSDDPRIEVGRDPLADHGVELIDESSCVDKLGHAGFDGCDRHGVCFV